MFTRLRYASTYRRARVHACLSVYVPGQHRHRELIQYLHYCKITMMQQSCYNTSGGNYKGAQYGRFRRQTVTQANIFIGNFDTMFYSGLSVAYKRGRIEKHKI